MDLVVERARAREREHESKTVREGCRCVSLCAAVAVREWVQMWLRAPIVERE